MRFARTCTLYRLQLLHNSRSNQIRTGQPFLVAYMNGILNGLDSGDDVCQLIEQLFNRPPGTVPWLRNYTLFLDYAVALVARDQGWSTNLLHSITLVALHFSRQPQPQLPQQPHQQQQPQQQQQQPQQQPQQQQPQQQSQGRANQQTPQADAVHQAWQSEAAEIFRLALIVLAAVGVAAASSYLIVEFFRRNQHVAVIQHAWQSMHDSLAAAAQATAEGYQTARVRSLLQLAHDRDTKLVLFAHSHAGMVVPYVMRQLREQQQQHLLDRLIVVGLGNPNHISHIPDCHMRVYQYCTQQDPVADMDTPALVRHARSLASLELRLQNPPTMSLGWHMAAVYLNLLLLHR